MAIASEPFDFTFRNRSGSVACAPDRLYRPRNADEVMEVVFEAGLAEASLKVIGAGHAQSPAAACRPRGWMMSLERMNRVLEVDRVNGRVRVQTGMRLGELSDLLANHGLALPCPSRERERTLGGALSLGSHGSSLEFGGLGAQVAALELVTPDAKLRTLEPGDGPLFEAAACGLGALGVLTEITLPIVPAYRVEESASRLPFEQGLDSLPRLLAENEQVRARWLPHGEVLWVSRQNRTISPFNRGNPVATWVRERMLAFYGVGALKRLGHLMPERLPRLNELAARLAPTRRRLVGPPDPPTGDERAPPLATLKYGVPSERAGEAMSALRALVREHRFALDLPMELEWLKGDPLPMSTAYGRDTCAISVPAQRDRPWAEWFRGIHEVLLPLGARPFLGSNAYFSPGEVVDRLPRAREFDALRRRVDPAGLFSNDFVTDLFGP